MTSEKQSPSALDLLGAISQAVAVERRQAQLKPGASKALKDLINKCVTEINKLTTVKKHRIDTSRKALIYNLILFSILLRTGEWFQPVSQRFSDFMLDDPYQDESSSAAGCYPS